MKLKVCGMKYNPEEVMALRPDYLGFIFWEGTPRDFTGREMPVLHEPVRAVGVFVDEQIPIVMECIRSYGLGGVQLHGQENEGYCASLHSLLKKEAPQVILIKAFAIGPGFDFEELRPYTPVCDYFLFDSRGPLPGGNGTAFDWHILKGYPFKTPYFLSGGIGEGDCARLTAFAGSEGAARCAGIDVNSKFEVRPGEKDIAALKRFRECGLWSGNKD